MKCTLSNFTDSYKKNYAALPDRKIRTVKKCCALLFYIVLIITLWAV